MKKTKVDELGRVVIPRSFREELNFECGSSVLITMENNSVVIRLERSVCKKCGAFVDSDKPFPLCKNCIETIKNNY